MMPSSGQHLNWEFLVLTNLHINSTKVTYTTNYTSTGPVKASSQPALKAPVQGILLRQVQSHHTVSSRPTTGRRLVSRGKQTGLCMHER